MNHNIIIGNGMTAKIFAFYNRDYKIIGKESSAVLSPIKSAVITLQNEPEVKKFLNDLENTTGEKLNYTFCNMDVMFLEDDGYVFDTTQEAKLKIIDKKLTDVDGKKLSYVSPVFQEGVVLANASSSVSKIIEIDYKVLTEQLNKVITAQILEASNVTGIDTQHKKITTKAQEYSYDSCVSTIPIYAFLELCGIKGYEFDSLSTSVIKGTESDFKVPKIPSKNAIVYYPQSKYKFTRIFKRQGVCYAEYTGVVTDEGAEVLPNSKMAKKNLNIAFEGVMFLGRYAEWNPNVRMQDVIRRSSDRITMQNIWANQRAFSSEYFNFTEDIKLMQENTKTVSMLMINEIVDLLNQTNWKQHFRTEKRLDIETIKEEWIDIFKYWLTLGINFGFSFEDFVKAYNVKSKVLDKMAEQKFRGKK